MKPFLLCKLSKMLFKNLPFTEYRVALYQGTVFQITS
jgi:hypothetical protein